MIDSVWITQTISSAAYVFQIELSDLCIERLKRKRLLGFFEVRKDKFEFLNDLRDVITEELMQKFLELEEQNETKE